MFVVRRWLWRLNGALLLAVLVAWGGVLAGVTRENSRSPPTISPQDLPARAGPTRSGPVAWDEIVRECGPWWPCDLPNRDHRVPGPNIVVGNATRLPLAAFRVTAWWRDPTGPDAIVLASKDPARPETYVVSEGQADRGVVIRRIEERDREGLITLARGEETFTFVVPLDHPIDRRVRGVGPLRRGGTAPEAVEDAGRAEVASGTSAAGDVKLVPFYGAEGRVTGVRVTGVRGESQIAQLGLKPGDVIERIGDHAVSDVSRALAALGNEVTGDVRVRRVAGAQQATLTLSR